MSIDPSTRFTSEPQPYFELVKTAPTGPGLCPEPYRDMLMIDTVHDGDYIPAEFLVDGRGRPLDEASFHDAYHTERDWGAAMVAEHLVSALGLPGHHRVNVARVLMDFGRFPGMSRHGAGHLQRFAINFPFSELLSYDQKRRVLEEYYDGISAGMEEAVRGRLIKIAIHTYDRHNRTGTERPAISLVTRAAAYQADHQMPFGVFDELYPDVLAEFTCDRVLRDRMSLTLEKSGFPVAHNYPYLLPEGSIEVRAQVWFFFDFLRQRFEEANPQTRFEPAFRLVWSMLQDTNLRNSESELLRSYLHMYRRAPTGQEDELRAAQRAYERVAQFLRRDNWHIVEEYRVSPMRPSSFGIEVRKDLVYEINDKGHAVRPKPEGAARVAAALAQAIAVYLTEDRPTGHNEVYGFGHREPWYFGADNRLV